jgi:type IX secretion system PorP/SprF family membrane protein
LNYYKFLGMILRILTTLFFIVLLNGILISQDGFRYTFFDKTPLTLNPGNAGSFEGTVRLGVIHRDQDYGLNPGQYQSPLGFVDAPIIRGFRKQDWIGFGVSFQYDNQATAANNLKQSTFSGGLSYHFAIDKNRKNILSIGMQSGTTQAYFTDQKYIDGGGITDGITNGKEPQRSDYTQYLPNDLKKKSLSSGYTIGMVYTGNFSEKTKLNLGLAVGNIGRNVNYTLLENGSGYNRKNLKFTSFAKYRTELENGLILEPRMVFVYMNPSYEGSFQALAGLKMKKPENTIVYAGLGYNIVNGLQFLMAADIKELRAFYSFDINLSDKTAVSGPSGAFEIGASYIFKIYKRPNPDPVLVCPQL